MAAPCGPSAPRQVNEDRIQRTQAGPQEFDGTFKDKSKPSAQAEGQHIMAAEEQGVPGFCISGIPGIPAWGGDASIRATLAWPQAWEREEAKAHPKNTVSQTEHLIGRWQSSDDRLSLIEWTFTCSADLPQRDRAWYDFWPQGIYYYNRDPPPPFQFAFKPKENDLPLITVGSLMELDPQFMDELHITCVLTCIGASRPEFQVRTEDLEKCREPEAAIRHINFCPNYAPGLGEFRQILAEVRNHRSARVHCKQGQKRSVIAASALAITLGIYSSCNQLVGELGRAGRYLSDKELKLMHQLAQLYADE